MFLLNAIQHKFKDIDGSSVAFVFFNVKGRDLMAIDETNTELPEKDKKIVENHSHILIPVRLWLRYIL